MSRNSPEMLYRSLSWIFVLLLAACGGGGGGSGGGNNGAQWNAPAPSASPKGTPMNWEMPTTPTTSLKIAYTLPDGMEIKELGTKGWVTMVGNNGKPISDAYYGECRVALTGLITKDYADQTLDDLALSTLELVFLSNLGNNQNIFGDSPANWSGVFSMGYYPVLEDSHHLQGISGEGWPYVELQGRLQRAGGAARYEDVRILLAQLNNNQYAAMIGYAYNYTLCVGEGANDTGKWVNLVYSLSFPEYQAADPDLLRKKLFGGWHGTYSGSGYSSYWSHVFAANGNDLSVGGVSTYTPIADTSFAYQTTSTWAGNGKWQLNNGKLSTWTDKEQPVTNYVRYYQSYNKSDNAWDVYVRTLEPCTDTNDGVTTATICENWMIKQQ